MLFVVVRMSILCTMRHQFGRLLGGMVTLVSDFVHFVVYWPNMLGIMTFDQFLVAFVPAGWWTGLGHLFWGRSRQLGRGSCPRGDARGWNTSG